MRKCTVLFLLAILVIASLSSPCMARSVGVNKALFASNIETFGIYEETGNRYKSGSTALIYLEVVDFMLKESKGTYTLDLSLDLSVIDSSGKEVGRQPDMLAFNKTFKSRVNDLYFTLNVTFGGWPPGKYTLAITVKDNKARTFNPVEMPVEIF